MLNFCPAAAFFLIFFLPAKSQERYALSEILPVLEKTYNVTFTYADDVMAGKYIASRPPKDTLEEWLRYLKIQTGLYFQPLNEQFIAISLASSFCGKLVNHETQESIAYASVATRAVTVVSDENGYFYIHTPLSLKDSITISHVAYTSIALAADEALAEPCREFQMMPRLAALPDLVVSNFLVAGSAKTQGGEFVMRPQEQQILPGLTDPDILFTLQAFPGIKSVNESVADMNIRGGTNDQNLVLWDDIRMYQTGHFFGLISAFNPYLVDNVTLIKNGTSAAYGDGVSGTIKMATKGGQAERISGGAGTNLIHSDFHLSLPITKKISLNMAARRSATDWFHSPTYRSYFSRAFQYTELDGANNDSLLTTDDHFYFYDVQGKITFQVSEHDQLKVNVIRMSNQLEYGKSAVVGSSLEEGVSGLEQSSTAGGIFYRRHWHRNLATTLQGYLSTYRLQAANHDLSHDQKLVQENEVVDIRITGKMHLILSPDIDLHGGYTYDQTGVGNLELLNNPAFRRYVREVLHAHFIFVEGNYETPDQNSRLQTGLRLSHYPRVGQMLRVEPRLSLVHQLTGNFSVEVLGEMKNQPMTQVIDLQNDFLGVEKRRWVLADGGEIPVIRSSQASAGLHYHKADLLLSLEGYYKKVDGIITSSQAFQNQYEFIRARGNYQVGGLDFLVRKIMDPFTAWVSYSLAKNTYLFESVRAATFPNNLDIRHHVFVGSSFKTGSWESSLGFNWHSGRPYTVPQSGEPIRSGQINYGSPNSFRLGNYLRVDFSSTYEFPLGEKVLASAGMSLWNITNRKNIIDTYYQWTTSMSAPQRMDRMALGFTPNLMFRVRF